MTILRYPDRASWLLGRRQGIGGSDAPAALGESPFKSCYSLWAEKTGLAEPDDDATEAMNWGLILEPVLTAEVAKRTLRRVERDEGYAIRVHESIPYMRATLDATQWATDGEHHLPRGPGVLQIKTAGEYNRKEWEDGPPLHYQIQLAHEIDVAGFDWGALCVLVGGNKLYGPFDTLRDDRFIAALRISLGEFWDKVQRKIPPTVDGSESTAKAIARLFPKDTGEVITMSAEGAETAEELYRVKEEIKALDTREAELKNKVMAEIGAATIAMLPDGGKLVCSTVAACSFQMNRKAHRRLTRSKSQ